MSAREATRHRHSCESFATPAFQGWQRAQQRRGRAAGAVAGARLVEPRGLALHGRQRCVDLRLVRLQHSHLCLQRVLARGRLRAPPRGVRILLTPDEARRDEAAKRRCAPATVWCARAGSLGCRSCTEWGAAAACIQGVPRPPSASPPQQAAPGRVQAAGAHPGMRSPPPGASDQRRVLHAMECRVHDPILTEATNP